MAAAVKSSSRKAEGSQSFSYVGIDPDGTRRTGVMSASSEGAVVRTLSDDGWVPISVKPSGAGLNMDLSRLSVGSGEPKMKIQELSVFARSFHQLLKAGISVQRSLVSLSQEAPPLKQQMLIDISEKIGAGVPLSEAMASYPKCFDNIFCAYIEAGEQSGTLVETTKRLSVMLAKRAELRQKIKQVTAYPKLVGLAILVLVTGILIFLVPQYQKIYDQFDAKLPAPTQLLVNLAGIFPFVLVGMAIIGTGLFFFYRSLTQKVELGERIDRVRFRVPIFGKLAHRQTLYRWATTFSGAISAGVPLTTSLALAAQASGSYWQLMLVPRLQGTIMGGRKLGEEISEEGLTDLYPASLRTMIRTGEDTGELPKMLDSVAEQIDDEIDTIVAGLSAQIEVALLLVLGVVVGGLLAVLYLPILKLATTVGAGLKK